MGIATMQRNGNAVTPDSKIEIRKGKTRQNASVWCYFVHSTVMVIGVGTENIVAKTIANEDAYS